MRSSVFGSRNVTTLMLWAMLTCTTGCGVPQEATLLDAAVLKALSQQSERGLVWMFPGLVGVPWELGPAYRGLRDAGLNREVRFFAWDRPAPDFFAHLTDYQANQAQAAAVAAEILAYRQEHPDSPIDLVGYSAGGMIALWVAEALPEDVRLRNVVLAQPDVSPTYDLTESLRRIDEKLVVFYSPNDWVLSAVFPRVFGTMDRQFVVAAGKEGFDLEAAVPDESLRAKAEQVGWSWEWAAAGHPGNHLAVLQYRWNKYCVAPYLVEPENLRIEADPATIDPTDGAPAGQSGLPHRSSAAGVPKSA